MALCLVQSCTLRKSKHVQDLGLVGSTDARSVLVGFLGEKKPARRAFRAGGSDLLSSAHYEMPFNLENYPLSFTKNCKGKRVIFKDFCILASTISISGPKERKKND